MLNFNCQISEKNFKNQPQKIHFGAGLTSKMMQEIQHTDVLEISNRLAKKGMPTDFKGNKVVAWCCDKTAEIVEQVNKRFGQKLSLPKGIYVEDFKNLKDEDPFALGTCNLRPTKLIIGSDEKIPSRTVFFNSVHDWNNIDAISDANYAEKYFSTDNFLYSFLHEFSHVIHEDRLLSKLGGKKLAKILEKMNEAEQLQRYRKTYGNTVRQICDYAENTPLDAVACDMSSTIAKSLDAETLTPTRNPFLNTPYEKLHFWQKKSNNQPLDNILRNFWNGKFE